MSNTNVGVPRNKPRYAPIRDCYAPVTKPDQAEHSHPRKRGRLANLIREGSEKIVAKAFNKLGDEKDLGSAKDPGQITLKNVDQWLEESGHKRVAGPSIKRKPVPTPAGPPKHQPLMSKKPRVSKFTEHLGDSSLEDERAEEESMKEKGRDTACSIMCHFQFDSFAFSRPILIFKIHVTCHFLLYLVLDRYRPSPNPVGEDLTRRFTDSTIFSMSSNLIPRGQGNSPSGVKTLAPANGWTRKDRPCDACRRRKSRCIIPEGSEICMMCHSRSEECTFVESPQRRKRQKIDAGDNSPEANKPRSPETERNNHVKPPINDYAALPNSLLKQTLGLQNRQHGHYLGQTTEYDTRLINLSPFNGRGEFVSTPGTLRRVSQKTHFIMKSESQPEVDEELANLDLVESIVKPHGRALVDLYFRIIHPSFPIMHKKVFLEKYDRTYREFTPPVMAAVYILALNWWSYSPDLVNLPKPDVQKLEKLVPKMMADVLNRPKLSTVQAGLLLLQRPDGDSWALTGQLVAVAQNLGLHLDCSQWKIPEWERSLRKRLAWALFMQDKWGALIHGRPAIIHREDWSVRPVETRDFPETAQDDDDEEGSSEIEKGRLIFVYMISLTEILAEILNTFFTLRATAELEAEGAMMMILERAKPIQLKLKEWHSTLPQMLAIGQTKARKLSSTGSLHLAYFAAEVTLHRAIIRFDSSDTASELRTITRSAAKMRLTSAIEMVNKLEPAHLQSFWYFASKVNLAIIGTFGSLLWVTSDSPAEAEFYRSQLAEYRWTLRVSSKAAEFMKFTVGMLDASPVFLKDKDSKTSTPVLVREQAGQEDQEGGQNPRKETRQDMDLEQAVQDYGQADCGSNEVSPSVGDSTENAYPYEMDFAGNRFTPGSDTRPALGGFADTVHFNTGHVPDWSLDQLYNFENLHGIEDVLGNRRMVEEYDEAGNDFAGF